MMRFSFEAEVRIIGLLLIPHSFDWLAAFHLDLLQAIRFIAV